MSASQAIEHRFPVGRFTCTVSFPASIEPGSVLSPVCEWEPHAPRRPLTPAELKQYRAGRNKAINELAERTGLKTAVVDL